MPNRDTDRNLNSYQKSVLALQLEPLYAAEAKRRLLEGNSRGGSKSSQKSDETSSAPFRTDERIAQVAGVSRQTIRKVKAIYGGLGRDLVDVPNRPRSGLIDVAGGGLTYQMTYLRRTNENRPRRFMP